MIITTTVMATPEIKDTFYQRITRIFRSGPSIRRKIRGYDYRAIVSKQQLANQGIGFYGGHAFRRDQNNYSILGAYGILDRLTRYQEAQEMEYCLYPDTKIAIPGGYKTIKELAEMYDKDEEFLVYSYDHVKECITPAMAKNPRPTRVCDAYRVVFDNGREVIGSSNHRLMKRDGSYCEIKDLNPGDSMMPPCEVVSVEFFAKDVQLYDMTVEGYENFATDSVISHNCSEISTALDLYADETCSGDETGRCFHVYSDNPSIQRALEELFYEVANIDFELRRWARTLPVKEDTIIPLLSGESITIKDLSEKVQRSENPVWVYSVQDGTNKVVPGKVVWCGKNYRAKTIVRVVLDNETFVETAPEHPFVLRSGLTKQAVDLKSGDSLMPFSEEPMDSSVLRTELIQEECDVYCMTVVGPNGEEDRHNFAVCSKKEDGSFDRNGVFVSNCKYGDAFAYVEVAPDVGVVNIEPIPVNEIEREEGFDATDPYAVRFKALSRGGRHLENWQVMHFRILGNDLFIPYGSAITEPARKPWRELVMLEDAMLTYRIARSPSRRVFYIDCSGIHPNEIPNYMEQVQQSMKSVGNVDKTNGRIDQRFNPLQILDDFYIPTRPNSQTKIETLEGASDATAIEDVEYIQRKLVSALKIPKAYLGFDDALASKSTLSMVDIRFARTIGNLQKILLAELNQLAILHLYARGFDGEDLKNFELKLSNPSTVALQQKLNLLKMKFEIAGSALELSEKYGIVDTEWVQKTVMEFRADDIIRMRIGAEQDAIRRKTIEALEPPKSLMHGEDGSIVDPFDPSNYQLPTGISPVSPQQQQLPARTGGATITTQQKQRSSTALPIKVNPTPRPFSGNVMDLIQPEGIGKSVGKGSIPEGLDRTMVSRLTRFSTKFKRNEQIIIEDIEEGDDEANLLTELLGIKELP